ncbi:MAG TPA: lasso RiPP family leader peptide-containing protein [Longimicrobiaceae bacterium]|nr:lasso RiPP family leader peptide-containing protein [Longimicrobiaceae bacterium]
MSYEAPKLTRYGTVSELTQGGTVTNSDAPSGTVPNSAYPPPS